VPALLRAEQELRRIAAQVDPKLAAYLLNHAEPISQLESMIVANKQRATSVDEEAVGVIRQN